jgi:hypothetical protein
MKIAFVALAAFLALFGTSLDRPMLTEELTTGALVSAQRLAERSAVEKEIAREETSPEFESDPFWQETVEAEAAFGQRIIIAEEDTGRAPHSFMGTPFNRIRNPSGGTYRSESEPVVEP